MSEGAPCIDLLKRGCRIKVVRRSTITWLGKPTVLKIKYKFQIDNVWWSLWAEIPHHATRAEIFRIVVIKINAWSSLFLNLETNLILCLYPEKCVHSTNQSGISEVGKFKIQKQERRAF